MYSRGTCDAKPGTTSAAPLLVEATDGWGEVADIVVEVADDAAKGVADGGEMEEGSCGRPEKDLKVRPLRMGSCTWKSRTCAIKKEIVAEKVQLNTCS